jgi:hypothetical protein
VAQAFSLRAQPERPCYFRLVAQGLRWRRLSACAHSLKGWAIFARPRAQSKRLSPEMATHLLNVVIELELQPHVDSTQFTDSPFLWNVQNLQNGRTVGLK